MPDCPKCRLNGTDGEVRATEGTANDMDGRLHRKYVCTCGAEFWVPVR